MWHLWRTEFRSGPNGLRGGSGGDGRTLTHRGPDHGATYQRRTPSALGFRRLSIIDLRAAANQPIGNEDGSVQLVFNGEIYNFRELRAGPRRARPPVPIAIATRKSSSTSTKSSANARSIELDGMFALAHLGRARAGR